MPISQKIKDIISVVNGFRKYSIMLILIILGVVFRLLGLISGDELVKLLSSVGVAFMASNSVEHMGKTIVAWVKDKSGGK